MAWSRPLSVAVVAFALLVGSVGFEVIFHRSFSVEVRDASGWQTIGRSYAPGSVARPPAAFQQHAILVNATDSLEFRVRVDNGYPWSYAHHYDVVGPSGLLVASGTLTAGARDVGESSFTLPASSLLSLPGPKETGTNVTFAYLTVQIGSQSVSANVQLQEAAK